MSDNERMTFGIEVELIAVLQRTLDKYRRVQYRLLSHPDSSSDDHLELVRRHLRGAGFDVTRERDYSGLYEKLDVYLDLSVDATCEEWEACAERGDFSIFGDAGQSRWLRERAAGLSAQEMSSLVFHPVEVVTPVLRADDGSGFETVRRLYHAINDMSCVVNPSAGLHVHVARSAAPSEKPLSLRALKNLGALAACADYQLAQLHPRHRVENVAMCRMNSSALDPRIMSNQAAIVDAFEAVENLCGLDEMLSDRFFSSKRLTVNLNVSPDDSQSSDRTVEFREHEAVLDGDIAVSWASLCVDLVRVCVLARGPFDFLRLYGRADRSIADLLRDVGLEQHIGHLRTFEHDFGWFQRVKFHADARAWELTDAYLATLEDDTVD